LKLFNYFLTARTLVHSFVSAIVGIIELGHKQITSEMCKVANIHKQHNYLFAKHSLHQEVFIQSYIPPFLESPGNGKPHLHIIKCFTNVTLLSPPRSYVPKLGFGDLLAS